MGIEIPEPKDGLLVVDTHCHLAWTSQNRENISPLKQYNDFKIGGGQFLITSPIDWESLLRSLSIKKDNKLDDLYITTGWGPQNVTYTPIEKHDKEFSKWKEFVLSNPEDYVAIGEIGLDFHHAKSVKKRERQIKIFQEIIRDTKHLDKPYTLHVRNPAKNDIDTINQNHKYNEMDSVNKIILNILKDEGIPNHKILFHCFSGPTKEWGKKLSDEGYYLSCVSSAYRSKLWREFTQEAALSQLVTETDAPFQHPLSYNSNNVPINAKYSIAALAYSHSCDQEDVAFQVLHNAEKFFNIQ